MLGKNWLWLLGVAVLGAAGAGRAEAQVIGSYSNFDCFNDTGEPAEGFEIDVEDVWPSDVTRVFPDNFSPGQPYIRYATPDRNALQLVLFPDGHTGVRIVYAASYVGGRWVAQWGSSVMPGTTTPMGDATPFVSRPTYTTGDSCWTLGARAAYPTSGCEHFGFSLAPNVVPGKITYHWLLPDPNNPGSLTPFGSEASLPPSPILYQNPPAQGQPPQVHAEAHAPEQPENEPVFGDAYWVKTYTSFAEAPAELDKLQKNLVPMKNRRKQPVRITWSLLQRGPAGEPGEKEEVEDEVIPAGKVEVTKRYEYFAYNGAYEPESHEVMCGGNNSCDRPVIGLNGRYEKGKYLGAHMNAYNVE
jgi:hypothetical protein